MRKLITLAFLVLTGFCGTAQNYMPLLSNDAMWLARHGNGDTIPTYYYYGLTGETDVVNSVTYQKLFRSEDMNFTANEYFMAVREDVANKKVYVLDNGTEYIMYDFTVNVGDTLDGMINGLPMLMPLGAIVHSIDSVLVGSVYHRQINFRFPWDTAACQLGTWVEGIGSLQTGALIYAATMQPSCDCAERLICYKKAGTWQYHNSMYTNIDCEGPLSVTAVAGKQTGAIVYPNPVTGTSQLQLSNSAEINTVEIYDITGKLVKSIKPMNGVVTIFKNEYTGGTYLYRLHSNDGNSETGRFTVE